MHTLVHGNAKWLQAVQLPGINAAQSSGVKWVTERVAWDILGQPARQKAGEAWPGVG